MINSIQEIWYCSIKVERKKFRLNERRNNEINFAGIELLMEKYKEKLKTTNRKRNLSAVWIVECGVINIWYDKLLWWL